jgi:hypothetical protein
MAYTIAENALLGQAFADTSTTKKHALGTIMRGKDPDLGGGEFIYLLGVANTVVGSVVIWDSAYQTTLWASGASLPRPVAFAMSANVASQYGWYQISGMATAAKAAATTFSAGTAVGAGATGLVIPTATTVEIQGAIAATAATNGPTTCLLNISRPTQVGRIT